MTCHAIAPSLEDEVLPETAAFYRAALQAITDANIPFLVGGAFAHACFTGIRRSTKDLDLFIRRADYDRIAELMKSKGWRTEMTYPHWLAKVYAGEDFIDLIFNSGNGVTPVDDGWFQHNAQSTVLGVPVKLANIEDSLTSKAYIMERERFDGADIAHLIQANAERIDWQKLVDRFGMNWRVLLSHLAMFGFVYPAERHRIPNWVMESLIAKLAAETRQPPMEDHRVCQGTLISREQYLYDVENLGYLDGRLTPASTMTAEDIAVWTDAIPSRKEAAPTVDVPPLGPNAASVTGLVDLA